MAFGSFGPPSYADADAYREEIVVQAPPSMPKPGAGAGLQLVPYLLFPLLGAGSMAALFLGRGGGGPLTFLVGGASALGMVVMLVFTLVRSGSQKKVQINDERRDYLRYLLGLRRQVQRVADRQSDETRYRWPAPEDLWLLAGTERMWRRRPGDADFAKVRVATGPQLLSNPLRVPETAPLEDLDPVSSTSLRRFVRAFATVPGLPVTVSLRSFARVVAAGDRAAVLGLARAIVAQLATHHPPSNLRIAACLSRQRTADWDWLKWLPHAADVAHTDAAGPGRLCASSLGEVAVLLGVDLGDRAPFVRDQSTDPDRPHVVVILDGGDRQPHPALDTLQGRVGVTFLDLGGWASTSPGDASTLDLVVDGSRLGRRRPDTVVTLGTSDRLDGADAEFIARQLAALGAGSTAAPDAALAGPVGLSDLLGIGDPRSVDPAMTWRRRSPRERLRVPIGVDPEGRPVVLDLKESAEGGTGPHGLVIGATGSGKSELLRTLVTALVVTHSSETLNLALVDFKGGATFAGMASLPHTCAVITNLSDELSLVDRMGDALRGEMVRRQELLRSAGNFASVRDYERQREAGAPLPPLPSLLVIIDEFSELLSERPELTDLFVMIGRLGRSLAIHLLFASQRLEEGRLRGLDSHLSYRIGLRTFSASESRAVLGVPDAYELPSIPGTGFLKTDTTTLARFKSAYVSGELPAARHAGEPSTVAQPDLVRFTLAPVRAVLAPAPEEEPAAAGQPTPGEQPATASGDGARRESIMDAFLSRLTGRGPAAHQIWLPPLDVAPNLSELLGESIVDDRGLIAAGWPGNGRLAVAVGIVDRPFEQRRDPLIVELDGASGNLVVVGGPRSGKSTTVRSLLCSLALTHTPREVQFFCVDLGGGGLRSLSGLPHTSGVALRRDAESVRRTVAEVTAVLEDREARFTSLGVDSIEAYRRLRATGGAAEDPFGDVFLVVDGWGLLTQEYDELEPTVTNLAAQGLGFGIHVVLTANRWSEIRYSLRDLFGSRLELRLGDPGDSEIDRRAAENVPERAPGRGLTRDKLHFLSAAPRLDGSGDSEDLAAGTLELVERSRSAWTGSPAPPVRLLPKMLTAQDLAKVSANGDQPGIAVPIGLNEAQLAPVRLAFEGEPHLMIVGDGQCGKTNLAMLIPPKSMPGRWRTRSARDRSTSRTRSPTRTPSASGARGCRCSRPRSRTSTTSSSSTRGSRRSTI